MEAMTSEYLRDKATRVLEAAPVGRLKFDDDTPGREAVVVSPEQWFLIRQLASDFLLYGCRADPAPLGAQVRLRSGGPWMTVTSVGSPKADQKGTVGCTWYVDGKPQHQRFPLAALIVSAMASGEAAFEDEQRKRLAAIDQPAPPLADFAERAARRRAGAEAAPAAPLPPPAITADNF